MDVITTGATPAGADPFAEPDHLISALLEAAGVVRLCLGEFLARYEMSEGRYGILVVLNHAGPEGLSQSEVAEQLMQSESNVSSLIERLHGDGLVDRRWSSRDRRRRVLLLTPDGQQLAEQMERARRNWAATLLTGMAPQDLRLMSRCLHQLPGRPRMAVAKPVAIRPRPLAPSAVLNSPQMALERILSTLGPAQAAGDRR